MRAKIDEQMKIESKPDKTDMMNRALSEALRGRQAATYLKKKIAAQRTATENDGMSKQDLDQPVPMFGAKACDDPGKKAVEDFMKLRKKMEADQAREGGMPREGLLRGGWPKGGMPRGGLPRGGWPQEGMP